MVDVQQSEEGSVHVGCSTGLVPAGGRWQLFLVTLKDLNIGFRTCWFSLTGDLLLRLDYYRLTRGYTPGCSVNNYKVRCRLSSCAEAIEPNFTPLGSL